MELEERLQKLSKQHSEHRRTFTLSRLAVFLCRGQLGQAGSIPVHGFGYKVLTAGRSLND